MHMIPMALTAAGTAGTAGAAAAGTAAAAAGTAGAASSMLSTALTAGTILQGAGQVFGAIGGKRSADFEADQMKAQAGQERASSQRQAGEDRRQKRMVQSRLTAMAAASGGGASDPTVVDIAGDLETEGEYRALSSLWEGEERARGLEAGAASRKMEGKQKLMGGLTGAAGTILSGSESLFDRFATKKKVTESVFYPKSKQWIDWYG